MLFLYFMMFIFSISFVVGVIGFFTDITSFKVKKTKTKIVASADGGDEDGIDGTDTGCDTTHIT